MVNPNATRFVGYIGAAANWLIPIAGLNNLRTQPAENIDPMMSGILAVYSLVFTRWAIAISPANYPLLACHLTNSAAQLATLGKYIVFGRAPAAAAIEGKK